MEERRSYPAFLILSVEIATGQIDEHGESNLRKMHHLVVLNPAIFSATLLILLIF